MGLFLFLPGEKNEKQKVFAFIRCNFYLVNNLNANILIGNNFFVLENFLHNVRLDHTLIKSYRVKIIIKTKQRGQFLRINLFTENDKVVPSDSEAMILFIPMALANDRDFLFYPTTQASRMLFAHIIHYNIKKILVKNTSKQLLRILHYQKMGHIVDICYNNYFFINIKSAFNLITVLS